MVRTSGGCGPWHGHFDAALGTLHSLRRHWLALRRRRGRRDRRSHSSPALPAATIAYAISGRGFLSGEDAPWVVEQRHWLEDVHLRALECDATASLGIGGSEVAAAERDARRLIRLAPYRESGYRLLMQALARRDNNAEALLVYEQLRTVLRDELGATPSPATQALHRRILGEAG